MKLSDQEQIYELSFYTLAHPDREYFIHQHIVDAYTAQNADINTKPISITFSLIGLYLYVEKNYSGRQVQLVHMQMAKHKIIWPTFVLPEQRGEIHISDVLAADPGRERDSMISKWCYSVWHAYAESREMVETLLRRHG
jgi:hypothetical protein